MLFRTGQTMLLYSGIVGRKVYENDILKILAGDEELAKTMFEELD